MTLTRGNSVRVANVAVPTRLLSTRNNRTGWTPRVVQEEEVVQQWPLQTENNTRRPGRYSLDVNRPPPTEASSSQYLEPLGRRLSNPVTIREADSVRSSRLLSKDDLTNIPPPNANREETIQSLRDALQQARMDGYNNDRYNQNNTGPYSQSRVPQRSGTVRSIVRAMVPDSIAQRAQSVVKRVRRNSMNETYEKAKARGVELERKKWAQVLFEYTIYLLLLSFIYFVLVGMPLWKGAVWWLYWCVETKFVLTGGWAITIGIAFL